MSGNRFRMISPTSNGALEWHRLGLNWRTPAATLAYSCLAAVQMTGTTAGCFGRDQRLDLYNLMDK